MIRSFPRQATDGKPWPVIHKSLYARAKQGLGSHSEKHVKAEAKQGLGSNSVKPVMAGAKLGLHSHSIKYVMAGANQGFDSHSAKSRRIQTISEEQASVRNEFASDESSPLIQGTGVGRRPLE